MDEIYKIGYLKGNKIEKMYIFNGINDNNLNDLFKKDPTNDIFNKIFNELFDDRYFDNVQLRQECLDLPSAPGLCLCPLCEGLGEKGCRYLTSKFLLRFLVSMLKRYSLIKLDSIVYGL